MTDRTDEETVELIREWLQQYGLTIITGIVLGVAGIGGYQWWQTHQLNQRYEQSAQLDALRRAVDNKNYSAAEKLYQDLQTAHDDIAELAGLSMAHGYLMQKNVPAAIQALETAASEGSDQLAQFTARWELANIAAQQGQFALSQTQLTYLQNSPYAGNALALQGYIYERQNQLPQAVKAYQDSLELSQNMIVSEQLNAIQARLSLQSTLPTP